MAAQYFIDANNHEFSKIIVDGRTIKEGYMNALHVYTGAVVLNLNQQTATFNLRDWLDVNAGGATTIIVTNSLNQPTMLSGDLTGLDVTLINSGNFNGTEHGNTAMVITSEFLLENNGNIRGAGGAGGTGGESAFINNDPCSHTWINDGVEMPSYSSRLELADNTTITCRWGTASGTVALGAAVGDNVIWEGDLWLNCPNAGNLKQAWKFSRRGDATQGNIYYNDGVTKAPVLRQRRADTGTIHDGGSGGKGQCYRWVNTVGDPGDGGDAGPGGNGGTWGVAGSPGINGGGNSTATGGQAAGNAITGSALLIVGSVVGTTIGNVA